MQSIMLAQFISCLFTVYMLIRYNSLSTTDSDDAFNNLSLIFFFLFSMVPFFGFIVSVGTMLVLGIKQTPENIVVVVISWLLKKPKFKNVKDLTK